MRFSLVITAVAAVICSVTATYPTNTDSLIGSLGTCASKVQSDIDCVESVQEGLETASDYIQDVRDLKNNMQDIYDGMGTMSTLLSIGGKLPTVGAAIKVMDKLIDVMKPTLKAALDQVKVIDSSIYPMKSKIDAGVTACEEAVSALSKIESACSTGLSAFTAAQTCIDAMSDGEIRASLRSNMETFASSANTAISNANLALGNVGTACDAVADFTDAVASWPDISSIVSGIDSFADTFDPILDFFDALQSVLDQKVCAGQVFKAVENVGNSIVRGIKRIFGRRKRSLRVKRDTCISVQDVLDGVDGVLDTILAPLNAIIDDLVDAAPSFSLPGLPSFDNLADFDVDISLPTIDFDLDTDAFDVLTSLSFTCGVDVQEVCKAGEGAVASSVCSLS